MTDVPDRPPHEGWDEPTDEGVPQYLVGVSFGDTYRAREFMVAAERLAHDGRLSLEDAVLLVKNDDGKTAVHETRDLSTGRTALSGALWAGLFGLILGGPVGWLAGGAIGAGAGAATAKVVDLGIPDEWVEWFQTAVRPGTSTVALLLTEVDHDALVAEARRFAGGELVYANLADDTLDRIRGALAGGPEE